MPHLHSSVSGNFTDSSTWKLIHAGSLLDSETNTFNAGTTWAGVAAPGGITPGAITIDGIGIKIANRAATGANTFAVRLVPQGAISSVSVGGPTTITTSTPHGLSTGDTVTISGTTTTPSINGSHTVTVTGATTFTIPVTVTSVTTGTGTWTTNAAAILSNSVAPATVITTTSAHGLTTGASITIKGNVGSVPSINGTHTVTVLSATTFSIPVSTTVGGVGGVWVVNSGSPDTTVAISQLDIPSTAVAGGNSSQGWYFFQFPSPVTLNAGTIYAPQVYAQSTGTLTVYRDAVTNNVSRFLRTTTNQAPAATDTLFITGSHTAPGVNSHCTVTMNNTTSTVFGKIEISGKGLLSYGTNPSTNYLLICEGDVRINGEGELRIGTSGSKIPASSTATLQINQGGFNANFGLLVRGTGAIQTWGHNKIWRTLLNGDVSSGATSLISTDVTGWSAGEDIVIASTTRTASETELRSLAVDSSGTTITVPALSFAHGGAAPIQAELANISRNVRIRGESGTLQAYVEILATASSVDFNDTEFRFLGSSTSGRRGIVINNNNNSSGTRRIRACAIRNFQATSSLGIFINYTAGTNPIDIQENVVYAIASVGILAIANTGSSINIDNCWAFSANVNYQLQLQSCSFTNCRAISATTDNVFISASDNLGLTVNNIVTHSATNSGININCVSRSESPFLFENILSWRNNTRGILVSTSKRVNLNNVTAFGNATNGVEFSTTFLSSLNNGTINGGTTLVQPHGITFASNCAEILIDNTTIGQTTPHSTGSVNFSSARQFHKVYFRNCLFADSTQVSNQLNLLPSAEVGSSRHQQTNGSHRMWRRFGVFSADSTFNVFPPLSVRHVPSSATQKLQTIERTVAIPAGKAARVGVFVRRSVAADGSAYSGALPRLILLANPAAGVPNNIVLATATAASLGSFEFISGTTPTVTSNTALCFIVDCDGVAGWINTGEWKVSIIDGAGISTTVNSENFWVNGYSFSGLNTMQIANSNSNRYWEFGYPARDIFPISNSTSGKFYLVFE